MENQEPIKRKNIHHFDLNLLRCLNNTVLVPDMIRVIFEMCADIRKQYRINEQRKPFCGISKSAMKRREAKFRICRNCGQSFYFHKNECVTVQSSDQIEQMLLVQKGPIRLYAERLYRQKSHCENLVLGRIMCIKAIKIKQLSNLTLEDLGLENHENARLPYFSGPVFYNLHNEPICTVM
jgi:hypothetical protein